MKSFKLHIIILFTCNLIYAQEHNNLLESINKVYNEVSSDLGIDNFNQFTETLDQSTIPSKFEKLTKLQVEEKELLKKELRNDIGLSFKGSVNHNLSDVFDDENNEFISTRFRAELEWNILKTGFVDNRQKSKSIDDKIQLLKIEKEQQIKYLWRRQYRLSYSYAIHKELIHIYELKLNFLNHYFDVLSELYSQKEIDREQIIKISHDLRITEKEIENYKAINISIQDSILPKYETIKLPFIVIADNNKFSPKFNSHFMDSLEIDILKRDQKWYQDISLSIYVNQNWISSTRLDRNYTSIGTRLKIPLRKKYRKEFLKSRTDILLQQRLDENIGIYNTSLTYYDSYREKLKDLQDQQKKLNLVNERQRKLTLLKEENGVLQNGLKSMETLLEQFEILKNMLQIKKQLYTSISHLLELDKTLNLSKYNFKIDSNIKVIITNSNIFSKSHQIAFLKLKNITKVYAIDIDSHFKKELEALGFYVEYVEYKSEEKILEQWMLEEQNNLKKLMK